MPLDVRLQSTEALAKRAVVNALATHKGDTNTLITRIALDIVKALDTDACAGYIDSAPIFDANDRVMVGFGVKPGIPIPAEKKEGVDKLAGRCLAGMEAALKQMRVSYTPNTVDHLLSFESGDFAAAILSVATSPEKRAAAAELLGSVPRAGATRRGGSASPGGAWIG